MARRRDGAKPQQCNGGRAADSSRRAGPCTAQPQPAAAHMRRRGITVHAWLASENTTSNQASVQPAARSTLCTAPAVLLPSPATNRYLVASACACRDVSPKSAARSPILTSARPGRASGFACANWDFVCCNRSRSELGDDPTTLSPLLCSSFSSPTPEAIAPRDLCGGLWTELHRL